MTHVASRQRNRSCRIRSETISSLSEQSSISSALLESTCNTSADLLSMSVKKSLGYTSSSSQTTIDYNRTNTRLLDRRLSNRTTVQPQSCPQVSSFTLLNHVKYYPSSTSMPQTVLPIVIRENSNNQSVFARRSQLFQPDIDIITDGTSPKGIPLQRLLKTDNREINRILDNGHSRSIKRHEQISTIDITKKTVAATSSSTVQSKRQTQSIQPMLHLVQYRGDQTFNQDYHRPKYPSSVTSTTTSAVGTDAVQH
jgi:hypothetical protein